MIEDTIVKKKVTARNLACLLGRLNSLRKSHGNVCSIMTRRSQHILGKYVTEFGWETKLTLDEHAIQELEFFRENYILTKLIRGHTFIT